MEEITIERLMNDLGSVIAQINDIVSRKDIASARQVLEDVAKLVANENGIVLDEESRPDYDHVLHELLTKISGVIEIVQEKDNSAEIERLEQELSDIDRELSGEGDALRDDLQKKIEEDIKRISELEAKISELRGDSLADIEKKIKELTDKIVANNQTPQLDENRAAANEPLLAERKELEERRRELIALRNGISIEEQKRVKTELEEARNKLESNKAAIEAKRKEIQEIDNSRANSSSEEQLLSEEQIRTYQEEIISLRKSISEIVTVGNSENSEKLQQASEMRTRAEELRRQASALEAIGQGKELTEEQKRRREELVAEINRLKDQIEAIDQEQIVSDPIAEQYAKDRQSALDEKAELERNLKELNTEEKNFQDRIADLNKIAEQKLSDTDRDKYIKALKQSEERRDYLDSKVKAADASKIAEAADLRAQADSLRKQADSLELDGKGKSLTPAQRRILDALLLEIADLEKQIKALDQEPIVSDPKEEEYAKERQSAIDENLGLKNRIGEIEKLEKELDEKIKELTEASEGRLTEFERNSYESQRKSANSRITEIDSLIKDEDPEKMAEAAGLRSQADELRRQADELEAEGQGKGLTEEQEQRKADLLARIAELERLIEESNNIVIPKNPEAAELAKRRSEASDKKSELEAKLEELVSQEAKLDEQITELNKKKGPRLTEEQRKEYSDEIISSNARLAEIDEEIEHRNALAQRQTELTDRIAELRGLIDAINISDVENPELAKHIENRDNLTTQIHGLENRIADLNAEEVSLDKLIKELEEESKLILSDEERKNHEDEIARMNARIAEIDSGNENKTSNEQRKSGLTEKIARLTDLLEQDSKRRELEAKKEGYLENKKRNLEEIKSLNSRINELEEENLGITSEIEGIDSEFEPEETLSKDERENLERTHAEKSKRIAEINAEVEVDDQYSKGARTIRAHADRLMELVAQSEQIIESLNAQGNVKNRNNKIQAQLKEIHKNRKAAEKHYQEAERMEARSQRGKLSEELAKEREDLIREAAEIRTTLTQDDEKIARNSARGILGEEEVQDYRNQIDICKDRIAQIHEEVGIGNDPNAKGARTLRAKADNLMAQVAEHEAIIESIRAEKNGKNKNNRIQKQQKQIREKSDKANKLYNEADGYDARAGKPEFTEAQAAELAGLEIRVAELEGLLEQNEARIADNSRREELENRLARNIDEISGLRGNVTRLESDNLALDLLVSGLDEETRELPTLTDEQRSSYQAEIESATREIEQLDLQSELDEFAKGARTLRAQADNLMRQVEEHNARIEEIKNDRSIRNKSLLIDRQRKQIKEKTDKINKLHEQADAYAARSKTRDQSEEQSREKAELLAKISELRGILEQDDARRERVAALDGYRDRKNEIISEKSVIETEITRLENERAELDALIASLRGESEREAAQKAEQRRAYEAELSKALAEIEEINVQLGDDQLSKEAIALRARITELTSALSLDDERKLVDEELARLQTSKSEIVANREDIVSQIAALETQISEYTSRISELDEETKTRIAAEEAKREQYRTEIGKAREEIAGLDGLVVPPDQEKLERANSLRTQAESFIARAAVLEEEGKARVLTPEELQEKAALEAKILEITTLLKEDDVKQLAANELLTVQAAKTELTEEKTGIQTRIGELEARIEELDGLIKGLDEESKTKIAAMEQRKRELIGRRDSANEKVNGLKALIVLPDITKLNLANDLRAQAESLVARAAVLEEEGKETKLTEEEAQERAGLDTRISKLAERLTKDEEARNAEKEVQGLQTSLDRIVEDRTNTEGQISGLDEKIAELDKLISGLDDATRAKIEEAKRKRDELVEQRNQANEELTKLDSIVVLADATKLSQAEEFRRQAEELLRQADVLEQEGQGNELTEEQLRAKAALELRIQKIQEVLKRNEERKGKTSKTSEQIERKNKLLEEISSLEGENVSLEQQIKKLESQIIRFGVSSLTDEQRKANEEEIKKLTEELEKTKAERDVNQKRLDELSQSRDKAALEQRKEEIQARIEQLKSEQAKGVVTDRLDLGEEAAKIGDAIFKTAEIRKELASRQISRDKFLEFYQAGLDMTNSEMARLNADLDKLKSEQMTLITDPEKGINLFEQIKTAEGQGDNDKVIGLYEELRKRFIKIGHEKDLEALGITGELKSEEDLAKMKKCFDEYRMHFSKAYNDILNDKRELSENAMIFAKEIERINAEKAILEVAQDPVQLEADAQKRKDYRRKLIEASITPKNELTEEQEQILAEWQDASDRFLGNKVEDKDFKYIDKDGVERVIKVASVDDSYPGYKEDVTLLGVPDYKENLEQISAFEQTQDLHVFGPDFVKAYEAAEALEPGAGKDLLDQTLADKRKYVESFNGIPNPHKVRYETLKNAGSTLTSMVTVDKNLPIGTRAKNAIENVGRFLGIRPPKFYKYNEHGDKVPDVKGGLMTLAMDGLVVGGVATAAITMGPAVAVMGYVAKGIVTAGNVVASRVVYARHKDEIDGNKPVLNQADPNAVEVARKSYYRENGDNRLVAWAKAKLDRYVTKDRGREVSAAIAADLADQYDQAEDKRTEAVKAGIETAEKNQKAREARQRQVALGANVYNDILRNPDVLDIDQAEAAIARNAAIEASKPGRGKEDVNPNAKEMRKDQYVKPEQPVIKTEDIDISGIDEVQGPVSAITAEQIYTGKKQQIDRINKVLTLITTIGLKFGYEAFKTGFTKTEVIHHDAVTKTETVHHDAEYANVEVTDYQTQYDTDSTFDGIIENATGKEVEGYYSVYGGETRPQTYVINEDDTITAVFQAEGRGGTGISDGYGLQAPVLTDETAREALLGINKILRNDLEISKFFDALKDANIDPATLDGMYVSVGDKYWVKLSDLMEGMTKEVAIGSHIETQLVREAWDETVTTVIKDAWEETVTKTAPELAIKALKEGAITGIGFGVADTLHEAIQTTYIAGNTPGRPEETMPLATTKFDVMAKKLQEEVNRQQAQNRQNGGQEPQNESNNRGADNGHDEH